MLLTDSYFFVQIRKLAQKARLSHVQREVLQHHCCPWRIVYRSDGYESDSLEMLLRLTIAFVSHKDHRA